MLLATVLVTALVLLRPGSQDVFLACYGGGVVLAATLSLLLVYQEPRERWLYLVSAFIYLLGFVVWNIDRHMCESVQHLHLHSVWHCLAGAGSYLSIIFWLYHRGLALMQKPVVRGTFPLRFVDSADKAV